MRRGKARILSIVAGTTALSMTASIATAVDYNWNNFTGGTYTWNTAGNWTPSGIPQNPGDGANVSGPAAGNLTINIASPVSIGHLTMGSTTAPVTTTIGTTGGTLTFDNSGADAQLNSLGVPGANNVIGAQIVLLSPLVLNESSTNGLTLSGGVTAVGEGDRNIGNNLLPGNDLVISGPIVLSNRINITSANHGTLYLGQISGTNRIGLYGGTIVFQNANNPHTGVTEIGARTLVLENANFGDTDELDFVGRWQNVFVSSVDRTISTEIRFRGDIGFSGDASYTLTGAMHQNNNRAIWNNLSPGNTLTIESSRFAAANTFDNRRWTIDGPGETIINVPIYNHINPAEDGNTAVTGGVAKQGTGTLTINSTGSTYRGETSVRGGLLIFGGPNTWGQTSGIVIGRGGAAGMVGGTLNSVFLSQVTAGSTGGLALTAADAAANINFTSGDLASRPNLSVGAMNSVTYTGTITPANNNYRLGGGGTLTLPNNNQLTGARSLTATNTGTVRLLGTNNYTGPTVINASYIVDSSDRFQTHNAGMTDQILKPTTLAVSQLADGGLASSIGTSSSAASNLFIQGGVLSYIGSGASTNRQFTMGTAGAGLDASGTGAVNFTSPAAIVLDDAEQRPGETNEFFDRNQIKNLDTSDLLVGMPVSAMSIPPDTIITEIINATSVRMSNNAIVGSLQGNYTITFGALPRSLDLSGSNTSSNTLSGAIADSAGGSVVSVNKTGTGTWVLAGNNTYSGGTNVDGGRLVIGHANALGSGEVNVGSAGTLAVQQGMGTHTMSLPNIEPGGRLDITNNEVVIQGSDLATVNALVTSGYAGGSWTGAGINSSTAAAESGRSVGIGPAGDDVLVKFTWGGDATLDGSVTIADLGVLAANWQANDRYWFHGDFNYDGSVNIADLGILAGNWQKGPAGGSMSFEEALAMFDVFEGVVVPEPSALGLVGLGMLALRRRRYRSMVG
jgi:MYXO-CTERM domain-containing protein